MKTAEIYICEICGAEFNDKDACLDCENGHSQPESIYELHYENSYKYPTNIDIKFPNDRVITYRYIGPYIEYYKDGGKL